MLLLVSPRYLFRKYLASFFWGLLNFISCSCFSVPSFKVTDGSDQPLYLIHPPLCCGGVCVNCCAEGNPCGKGCCKQSFRVYNADIGNQGGDEFEGVILKKPKSLMTEVFTDANAFEVTFPTTASADQKGILTGAAIFINSIYYEGDQS